MISYLNCKDLQKQYFDENNNIDRAKRNDECEHFDIEIIKISANNKFKLYRIRIKCKKCQTQFKNELKGIENNLSYKCQKCKAGPINFNYINTLEDKIRKEENKNLNINKYDENINDNLIGGKAEVKRYKTPGKNIYNNININMNQFNKYINQNNKEIQSICDVQNSRNVQSVRNIQSIQNVRSVRNVRSVQNFQNFQNNRNCENDEKLQLKFNCNNFVNKQNYRNNNGCAQNIFSFINNQNNNLYQSSNPFFNQNNRFQIQNNIFQNQNNGNNNGQKNIKVFNNNFIQNNYHDNSIHNNIKISNANAPQNNNGNNNHNNINELRNSLFQFSNNNKKNVRVNKSIGIKQKIKIYFFFNNKNISLDVYTTDTIKSHYDEIRKLLNFQGEKNFYYNENKVNIEKSFIENNIRYNDIQLEIE